MWNKPNGFLHYIHSLRSNVGDIPSLALAIFIPAIFFSPYLFTKNPQYNFFGDVAILYFPQFVHGYHLAKEGIFIGIDFLTGNGSTAYFLRPNIPAYYPPYQLTYALFKSLSIEGLARAFVLIAYAHSILAAFFCMRVARKYFQMTYATSLLFAVLYFCAIADTAFTEPPFYYSAALFPLLIYIAFLSFEMKYYRQVLFYSFPYVLIFLSGYLPLAVNAVAVSLLFSLIYCWQNKSDNKKVLGLTILKLFAPVALASIVVLPLYLAMFFYHNLVPGLAKGVWSSAHQFSLVSQDIFAFLSRSFPSSNPGTGAPFIRLGLPSILLIILAFSQRKKLELTAPDSKIISLSLSIFFFYVLLAFGANSGLPDLFYFVVPVLGEMHLYGRYLLVASFFFYLAVAISFKYLVDVRKSLPIGRWIVGLCLIIFLSELINKLGYQNWININILIIELLMIIFMLVSLSARYAFYAFLGTISISFFISVANFNSYTTSFTIVTPGPYANDVAYTPPRQEAINNYFFNNSSKYLIKYVDITSGIEKPNGLMLNYPWFIHGKLKLSNYMGYEPHLAVDKDYMDKFPYPYYGSINIPWVLNTGADFLIYDQASWEKYSGGLNAVIDQNVPKFDLGFGYKAAKLKEVPEKDVGNGQKQKSDNFDNGIVTVSNNIGTAVVSGFKTDLASRVDFYVESVSPALVKYNLFPNKMMRLYIDGAPVDPALKNGLLEFTLPPGTHRVQYIYKNKVHLIFIYLYFSYLILLVVIVVWRMILGLNYIFNLSKNRVQTK